jgi:Ca2+-binding RTX toxin-like protein
VDGIIDLGAGDDIFNGGNTREVVKDHFGRDTYNFGGGNDHFVGYLNGSDDRTDKIDGGKGIDAYDASQAGVLGVFINLDTISHYDFIRDVDLAALRADDLFNAATAADKILSIENAYGSSGDDSVFGTKAANELAGGDGFDILYGLAGNDRLLGGDATDALVGGAGRDELWGGADGAADVFIFRSLKDSGPTQATRDTIKDFGVGDTIDLHAINDKLGDVITGFLGVDVAFTGHKGDLRAVTSGDNTIVQLDVNGDKKADCTIQLDGHIALTIDDFNL